MRRTLETPSAAALARPLRRPNAMTRLTPDMLQRFDRVGPRYTSYPTADRMHAAFGPDDYANALARIDAAPTDTPLSVYAHFPHCSQICRYCACNIIGTRSQERRADYVQLLLKEIDQLTARLPHRRTLGQLHFGGGTPNSYSIESLGAVLDRIRSHFRPTPDAEIAIEVDPRHCNPLQLQQLHALGFNRVSFGVQDFYADVQTAIGRHQSAAQTRLIIESARQAGFRSVNCDLVYGLPRQSLESFRATLDELVRLRPDRVALFSFAFIPRLRINQRRIDPQTLPEPLHKLEMLCAARDALAAGGYVAVGMDHFALPDDTLATAHAEHRLCRNFQGYSVKPAGVIGELETLAVGLTAIGDIGTAMAQNTKDMHVYAAAIEAGAFPIERGFVRSPDDLLRRALIASVMTDFTIPVARLAAHHGPGVRDLMRQARPALDAFIRDGLVVSTDDGYALTELGELFPRLVAMAFDAYFAPENANFSRIV
jgi:oxygen-independent coproporphyrinogen-3 oxidase